MFERVILAVLNIIVYILCALVGAWLLMLVVGGGADSLNWSYNESISVTIGVSLAMSVFKFYEGFSGESRKELDKARRV